MQWMNDLTIAVIEEDALRIGELVKSVPDFHDIETAQNALKSAMKIFPDTFKIKN